MFYSIPPTLTGPDSTPNSNIYTVNLFVNHFSTVDSSLDYIPPFLGSPTDSLPVGFVSLLTHVSGVSSLH